MSLFFACIQKTIIADKIRILVFIVILAGFIFHNQISVGIEINFQ